MSTPAQELLKLRLRTLRSDVGKVQTAVTLVNGRDVQILEVARLIGMTGSQGVLTPLSTLSNLVFSLRDLLGDYDDIAQEIKNAQGAVPGSVLLERLEVAPQEFEGIKEQLREARDKLLGIQKNMVDLSGRSAQLENSLSSRCDKLYRTISVLEQDVGNGSAGDQRVLWQRFETMLVEEAQPLFREYVDFLGGLTVRDTGLDDRVCEMTEVLLRSFTAIVTHFFPIPAAQAALSSAMDSVVKLGFPEWSVWGIPLVAHEVGLALCADKNEEGVQGLLGKWGGQDGLGATTTFSELVGDAFAAFTMGPAYGCAALLLRLQPHHDEASQPDQARDVDRARLILGVLRSNAGDPDTGFATTIRKLDGIWRDAVTTLAGPARQEEAERELAPKPEEDWLDDFQRDVLVVLRSNLAIAAFTDSQWSQVVKRKVSLLGGQKSPLLDSPDDLLEILNAAWAARLDKEREPDVLAAGVTEIWEGRIPPARDRRTRDAGGGS